jgi:hypothetical protein
VKPLKISDNGRYFTKDGAPFFWLGDTIWPAASAYNEEELEYYFGRRAAQGFTVAHIMIPWVSLGGELFAVRVGDSMENMPFWLNNNPATPNEEYFKLVDRVVRIAAKYNMYVVILPCGGGNATFVDINKVITAGNARAYARWVAERYKDEPNVIWSNGFDTQPWNYEDVAREFAAGIRESGTRQLMTYHACGPHSSSHFHNEDWLDMNFIQTWADYKLIPEMVAADYDKKPAKPVVHVEGAYEDGVEYPTGPINSYLVRWQAYMSILSGASHSYGHNDMWRKTPHWRDCVDAKGANEMKVLKDFFTSLEWWKLKPDLTLIDTQGLTYLGFASDVRMRCAAAISEDGDFAVVYFTSRMELPVYVNRIGMGKPIRVIWIDPTTGKHISECIVSGHEKRNPDGIPGLFAFTSPPCCDDAILLLRA